MLKTLFFSCRTRKHISHICKNKTPMKKPHYEKAFSDLCKWIASEKTTLIPKSTLTNKIHRIKEEHIYPETNPELFNEERKQYGKQ